MSPVLRYFLVVPILFSCDVNEGTELNPGSGEYQEARVIKIEAENFTNSSGTNNDLLPDSASACIQTNSEGWIAIDVPITISGRYLTQMRLSSGSSDGVTCWIEDHYDNKQGRIINVTGYMSTQTVYPNFDTLTKEGSPLKSGIHKMKIHFDNKVTLDWVKFTLIQKHEKSPKVLTQKMIGAEWKLVWSDEFDQSTLDTTKWTFDTGDWGWGNNELQYYTNNREENVRVEDGSLIIEARRNDMKKDWTSGRLTTRGKVSFRFGKIVIRAKVPYQDGSWAAGWTLGDEYVDELSRFTCGEIDILESVGFEIDDTSGDGMAHASAHSGTYYFGADDSPVGTIEVDNMNKAFHIYSAEWKPDRINNYLDDRLYVTYDHTSNDLAWPFSKPQNIILHLAMGGGWAGAHGIDGNAESIKMIIDYVRVYELQ